MCGLVERFNPAVMAAMTMIEGPRFVRIERHSPYAPRIKTGVAWDLLMHDLDMALRLFHPRTPSAVDGQVGYFHPSSHQGAEDVVEASLRFDAGERFPVGEPDRPTQVADMVIQELGRMIEVDLLRRGVTAYRHTTIEGETAHGGFRQYTEIEVPEIVGTEPLVAQLDYFARLARGEVDVDAERGRSDPLTTSSTPSSSPPTTRSTIAGVRDASIVTRPTTRAGTPAMMLPAGTSWVTTAPAPITAPSPIVTPMLTTALAPTKTRSPITTGRRSTSGKARPLTHRRVDEWV